MPVSTVSTVKKARKPHVRLTEEKVLAALRDSRGMVAIAARKIPCDRAGLHRYINAHPKLLAALDEEREFTTDTAEGALYLAISRGEAWAVQFYLKTQGKGRGYVERLEHAGVQDRPIEVIEYVRPYARALPSGEESAAEAS